jgi:hypothetical protein
MTRVRLMLFTSAAIAAFAPSNFFLYSNPPETGPITPASAPDPGLAAAGGFAGKAPSSELLLVHTQTRPLFSPTRRKWVESAQPVVAAPEPAALSAPAEPPARAEPAAAETPPPAVTLIGIQMTPLGSKALLLKTGAADALWFKSGEKLEGWAVQAIDAGSVEMALGEKKIKLELYPPLPAPRLDP